MLRLAGPLVLVLGGVALAQGTAPTPSPPPTSVDVELAKAHFHTGEIYYQRQRFADAAREFEEAYRLSGRPDLLFNMGTAYTGGGDHARALTTWRRYLEAAPNGADRPTVLARLAQLERLVGRLTFSALPEGAMIDVDGTRLADRGPVQLNPGKHHVEVAKEGYRTLRRDVVIAPDRETPIVATLESLVQVVRIETTAPRVPVYKRWWLWTAVGLVAAGGVVTGAVIGSRVPPVSGDYAQLPSVR